MKIKIDQTQYLKNTVKNIILTILFSTIPVFLGIKIGFSIPQAVMTFIDFTYCIIVAILIGAPLMTLISFGGNYWEAKDDSHYIKIKGSNVFSPFNYKCKITYHRSLNLKNSDLAIICDKNIYLFIRDNNVYTKIPILHSKYNISEEGIWEIRQAINKYYKHHEVIEVLDACIGL